MDCCRIFLVVLFLQLGGSLYSQLYTGVKLGYAIPFSRSEVIKYDDELDFLTYKMQFIEQDVSPMVSVILFYKKDFVFLQGEAGYRVVKTRFHSTSFINPEKLVSTESVKRTQYIRVPVSAGINFDRFHFGAGPVFGFIIGQNQIFEEIESFEERRKQIDAGFQFIFGVTVYRLQWELSYEYQFNSVADYLYYREDHKSFASQAQFINLSMAFLF